MIDNPPSTAQGEVVDLDTALLRAFVVTAQEGHFGQAADRLFISQQALSKRVARLEATLGVRLFERTSRSVELTAAGERLLPAAREALEAVATVMETAGVGGPLRVDVMDEHAAGMQVVRQALDGDPHLQVETSARGAQRTAVEALLAGEADVALGRASAHPWPTELRRRPALMEPIGVLVRDDHALAHRPHVTMAELAHTSLRFPMTGAPADWVTFLGELCDGFGLAVDVTGCALGFEHFVDHPAQHPESASFYGLHMRPPADPRLRVVRIVEPTPVFAWSAMWRRRFPESAVDRIVPRADKSVPEGSWLPEADRAWLPAGAQSSS